METTIPVHTTSHVSTRRQAYVLLALGIVCLLGAWLLHPKVSMYPLGVLFLGLGMLISSFFNLARLFIGGCLVTAVGLAVFLIFKQLIPGNQTLSAFILAIGVGLLPIAFMARRRYIGVGAVSPALIVILIGIIEVLLAMNLTPLDFAGFMLSLWQPGFVLVILGVLYFLSSLISSSSTRLRAPAPVTKEEEKKTVE